MSQNTGVYNVYNLGPVPTYSTRVDLNLPKRIVMVDSPNTLRVFSSRMRALIHLHKKTVRFHVTT